MTFIYLPQDIKLDFFFAGLFDSEVNSNNPNPDNILLFTHFVTPYYTFTRLRGQDLDSKPASILVQPEYRNHNPNETIINLVLSRLIPSLSGQSALKRRGGRQEEERHC
jgi:hypothetical protein